MLVSSPESVGMCSAKLANIKPVLSDHFESCYIVGATTLLARHGKIVHFEQIGFADKAQKKPMQADSLFRIYSMTKPVVATALMILQEQCRVDLLEPVSKYIPSFANLKVLNKDTKRLDPLDTPVTIRHLLTHTAGLTYDPYLDYPDVSILYRQLKLSYETYGVSLEAYVDKVVTCPLAFQPGSTWHYSVGIDVAARVIEIISGQSIAEFLNENIFAPLGMDDTSYFVPESKRDRIATLYGDVDFCGEGVVYDDLLNTWAHRQNNELDVSQTYPIDDPQAGRGGLGLFSTTTDYYRFCQMLLNQGELDGQRLLSPGTVKLMHMNHLSRSMMQTWPMFFGPFEIPGYGFGLGSRVLIDTAPTGLVGNIGEYGWSGAAKSYYWIDPKAEFIGVFMAQSMVNYSLIDRYLRTLAYQALTE